MSVLRELMFAKGMSGGGSGGGGGLLVEIVWDNDTATLNKNYEEIMTAILNGINPVFATVDPKPVSGVMSISPLGLAALDFINDEYVITLVSAFTTGNDFLEFKSSTSTGTPTYTG